jgi:hypothetical protein
MAGLGTPMSFSVWSSTDRLRCRWPQTRRRKALPPKRSLMKSVRLVGMKAEGLLQ